MGRRDRSTYPVTLRKEEYSPPGGGVVLPLGDHAEGRQAQGVDQTASQPVRAQILASAPLLRAGLERAALAAGLQLTEEAQPTIGLHSSDTGPTRATLDLSVGANLVTIVLTAVPDRQTWTAVWRLLAELVDTAAQ